MNASRIHLCTIFLDIEFGQIGFYSDALQHDKFYEELIQVYRLTQFMEQVPHL